MTQTIRKIQREDLPSLKLVLDSSELFPSEMLDDMITDFLTNPESKDYWFTVCEEDTPVSIAYCAPEQMTEGTFNLYAIAVHKHQQVKGIGAKMMHFLEDYLRGSGARILIVETSGTDDFEQTRKFYEKIGYLKQAIIPEFYSKGDDKVVFWKKLND